MTEFSWIRVYRGEVEALAGNIESSLEYFDRALMLTDAEDGGLLKAGIGRRSSSGVRQSDSLLALLFAYRISGRNESANQVAGYVETQLANRRAMISAISEFAQYEHLYAEAQYHAIEGHTAEALETLQTWVEHGTIFTYISLDPFLDSLRGNPGFEAIVAAVEAELAEVRAEYFSSMATAVVPDAG